MDRTQIIIVGFCMILQVTNGFIAYDCGAPSMNMTTLALTNIKKCEIPISNPVITITEVQLLQATDISTIRVYQCKVEIHRSIYHCGMHSHISIVSNAQAEYIEETTYESCKRMHATLELIFL